MSKKYDSYGVREEEVIYLAQPGKKVVCALGSVDRTTVSLEDKLNDISELTFEIDKYYNGEPVPEYDWVDQHMLLYVDGIWFKIKEQPIIKTEDLREYKEVTAMSLETELQQYLLVGFKVNQGTVDSIEKIYQDEHELDSFQQVRFYNKDIPELSLVDAILAYANVPDWKIGYVDDITIGTEADLNGEYKTLSYEVAGFEVESQDVYSFLTQDVSKTFSCMFQFDTENKLINVYRVDAVGYDTNIILGFRNLQNSLEVSCDTEMYTAFEVRGNEDMTIDYVNFDTSQIEDISYFLNTKYMSQELIDKYNVWIEYRESRRPEYIELSGEYNTLLNTISEITYRVPTDGVENDWTTYEEDDLTLALDNYNAMVTQLEHLYVDDHGDFDLEALKASTDWELYKQIVDYIIPSIKAALQKQGVDTSTNGVGNMFTNVNPIITIGWQTTTEDILTPVDITDKPCNGIIRGIQVQSNGGFYQAVNGLIVGDTYTISVYVKCESNGIISIGNSTSSQDDIDIIGSFDVTNEWVRVNVSFVALEKYYQCYFTFGEGNYVVCGMQLECGTLHDFGYFAGLGNETDILSAWETDWNLYGTVELKNKLDSYKNAVESLKESGFDTPYLEGGDYSWEYHTKMYQKYMDYYSLIDDCQKAYDERCEELKVQEDKCDEITEQRQQIVKSVQKENFGSVQETYDGFTDEELSLLRTFINQTDYVNENITLTTLDTEKEKVNQQYDLYLKAKEQLYIESHPQYIYSDTVDNLYALPEFKEYHEGLKVGNFLWIEDSEEHFVKLRVVTIKYNPCTWDNDITIEFSNMVQGQSNRIDAASIIQSAIESTRNQIIGMTNNNDITTYTITSEFIRHLLQNPIMNNAISTGSSNAVSSVTGQIDYLVSKSIKTEKVTADVVNAVTGNFQKIFTTYIEGDLASFSKTVTDFLMAGQIITDDVKSATGAFTNYLTGVRILGDLIEANTIIADKLILRGSNESVVYQLNQLGELTTEMVENIEQYQFDAGKVIIADSITSREINVNDLWVTGIANMLNANIGNAFIHDLTSVVSHLGNWYFHDSVIEGDYASMLIGGYLQSKNYTETNGVVTAGCKIDLNNFSIDSPNFKISPSGNVEMKGTLAVGSKVSMGSVYNEDGKSLEEVLNTIGGSINLHTKDGQIFTESASVITPDSITINAVCDGDVTVAKWLIDDVENTEYVADDKMSITIPSSYIADKKQITIEARNEDGTVFDSVTLYRLVDADSTLTVVLTSSNGELFTSDTTATNTTITATVYRGSEKISANSYTWYLRKDNASTWTKQDVTTRTLKITLADFLSRVRVRCLATVDSYTIENFIDLVKVKDGKSGKTQYLHIMYSDVEEPTDSDITTIPTTYIGICVDENKTAPSTASSYTWAKFQGSDGKDGIGIKGDKGEDGLTQYTHIKFSDDAKNFTANNGDVPGRYIGFFVDHNEDAVLAEEFYEPWIPIRGADGVDGGTGFFYVAYSANPNGYPMTTEPQTNTKYMGVYSGVEGEVVTDYTKFKWTRIQGNDGIDGVDGKDGKSYYTWVKYANSATPTEMSDIPDGMDYIGIAYNKETRVESDDPNDYAWSLLRGKQGIQGIPGDKGEPLYTWIKYADTPTTGMSDTPEGKDYMGIAYNKETIEESEDYSDYQWIYIRGSQGIPGKPGVNGKSSYLHIRYSNDGGVTFTDGNGETLGIWIGTYVDENLLDSDDISDYRWKKFVGEDGKDGIGYTIALSNENHGFVADGDGVVQAEQIQIKVCAWLGVEPITTTVTVPELPVGMTATVSNNGTDTTYITLNVDSTLTDTQGTVEFGVTADGVDFVKVFSWSVNRGGKDGKPGTIYGVDSSSTSAVYNIRNGECTPSSISFNAYYSEGDSKEKLPLDCYMQISYTSTGSTWIKYGERLHCTNGTTAFNFLSASHLDGLPTNTETGIITAVKCEVFATATSETSYASKELAIIPSMNELAVLGFVEENNTIYVDGSNFYAGSIHTSALAAEVIKSIGCEYSSSSVYTTKGTYFDLATGVFASQNFAIDTNGNAFFKGEITATSGKIGGFYIDGNAITNIKGSGFGTNSSAVYLSPSGISLGTKFKVDYYGNITATSGTIGGFTITDNSIYKSSNSVGASGGIYLGDDGFSISDVLIYQNNELSIVGNIDAKSMTAKDGYYVYKTGYGSMPIIDSEFIEDVDLGEENVGGSSVMSSSVYRVNIGILKIATGSSSSHYYSSPYLEFIPNSNLNGGKINVCNATLNCEKVYSTKIECSNIVNSNNNSVSWDGHTHSGYATTSHTHNALKSASNDYRVKVTSNGNFKPSKVLDESDSDDNDNVSSCGTSSSRWTSVYAAKGTIQTSDKNEKENINDIDERYEKMFMQLRPVIYRWKNIYSHENHDRFHCGLIAQEVYEALINNGLTMETFAVVGKDDLKTPTPDGRTERWNMNYSELHGLEIHMIQKMFKEIEKLKETIDELKESCSK